MQSERKKERELKVILLLYAAVLFFASLFIIIRIFKRKGSNGGLYTGLLICMSVGLLINVFSAFSLGVGAASLWWYCFIWSLVEVIICWLAFRCYFWNTRKEKE
ncbi:MAG: hypothetical protein EOM64_02460 [Erysipelotrichia bacterium]|nr:hypothetical protein [Erysipelotrichia bacterium]